MTTAAPTPLATTTAPDWQAAAEYLTGRTGENARTLHALTALHGEDFHHIVLDPGTRVVWWAYDNTPLGGEGWTVDRWAPQDAAAMAGDQIELVQDRQEEAAADSAGSAYALGAADLERDEAALDEYAAVLLLSVPADPRAARAAIQRQRDRIARTDALWRRAYAAMTRDLASTQRGGKARAAKALGISDVQVHRIITDDDRRRGAVADAVRRC